MSDSSEDSGRPRDVVVFAELDWDGLHCQSHVFARGLAERGHRVLYVNRTLQRWPTLDHLRRRLKKSRPAPGAPRADELPANIAVVTLLHAPPVRWLRSVNRLLVGRQLRHISLADPIMIVYVPSFLALDVGTILGVGEYYYVCYHNFDADRVLPDLLRSEREIIRRARTLFADSGFLRERLGRLSGGRDVLASPPGVNYDQFATSFRGDEAGRRRVIGYFGGVGPHLNIAAFNALADVYDVVMIGIVDSAVRRQLSSRIDVRPPVGNQDLPGLIREWDIIGLLYKDSPYMHGVIPAKFYECLATGKPVLVSGLREAEQHRESVYVVGEATGEVLEAVRCIDPVADQARSQMRRALARGADWGTRFRDFHDAIFPGER